MALLQTGTYLNNYFRNDGGSKTTMPLGDYTLAMWVKHTGSYSVRTTIFQVEGSSFSSDSTLGTTNVGTLSVVMNGLVVVSGGAVTADTWKYVALTHTTTTFEIWMGAEAVSITSQGSNTNVKVPEGSVIQFFADDYNGFYFDGAIAYPRMWDVALTGVELEAERASTTVVKSANIWAYWDFSAATATIADGSGNSRTITKVGTITTTTDPTVGVGGGGRAAKNTRGWGLGMELGMGNWMAG